MKAIVVGDMHAVLNELNDCERVIDAIVEFQKETGATTLIFLGDQTHNHAVLNVFVMAFWNSAYKKLSKRFSRIVVLVGNHDLPGNTGQAVIPNSMQVFSDMITVVDDFYEMDDCLFVGYQFDHNKFIDICHKNQKIDTVFCHQTFQGAQYENGFYATDGIEPSALPNNQKFFSGHIHSPAEFANVKYIGAPRWRTVSDASVNERNIVLFDTVSQSIEKLFCLNQYVSRMVKFSMKEDLEPAIKLHELVATLKPEDKILCDLEGSKNWIDATAKIIDEIKGGKNAPKMVVKTSITDNCNNSTIKESEGISVSIVKYARASQEKTPPEVLLKMIEERILCQ